MDASCRSDLGRRLPADYDKTIIKKCVANNNLREVFAFFSDLEEALLLIPFSVACEVVKMLPKLLDRGDNTELFCRLAIFLLKIHHAPLVANQALLKHMIQIQAKAAIRLAELRVSKLIISNLPLPKKR